MDYFLDTNVELGYVFCTDPWNTPAVTVFDSNDKLHYSRNVDKEFRKNFAKFLKEQKHFFYRISDELEYLGLKNVNYNTFESIGLSVDLIHDFAVNKKESFLKKLWDIANKNKKDNIKVKNLVRDIRIFARNFEKFIFDRKINFEKKVVMCLKRVKKYSKIFKRLAALGIHEEDIDIVLDAHDLACRESLFLNFVTSDNDVYRLSSKVMELNINEFLHLKNILNRN